MRQLWQQLLQRNLHRVAIGYLGVAWLVVQVIEVLSPAFGYDDSILRWAATAFGLGFVPALALAWAFSQPKAQPTKAATAEAQETGGSSRLDRALISILAIAVLFFAIDRFLFNTVHHDPSIAVLPFDDLSAEQNQAWFADGLAEDILRLLAKNPALNVVARTSSFSFRSSNLTADEIAQRLGVHHILEGSVRRDGTRVRVTAQLIDAENGYHTWSHAYDVEFDDIFGVQDQIAGQILSALETEVLDTPPTAQATNAQGYALYLQARHNAITASRESLQTAKAQLQQVVALDPGYAPAWASLATVLANLATRGIEDHVESFEAAKQAALRAIDAAPDMASGYFQLAWIAQQYDHNLQLAIDNLTHALTLEPANPAMLGNAAVLLLHIGRLQDAIEVQEYSAQRSPVEPSAHFNLGLDYAYADRLAEAEEAFRHTLKLSPEFAGVQQQLGQVLLLGGRAEEALTVFAADKDESSRTKGLALAHFALGNIAEADAALQTLIDRWGNQWPSEVVHVYAYRGELETAFDWLQREYDRFGPAGWGEWRYQRLFDNLREDPRWSAFIEKVGVSAHQLNHYRFEVTLPD